MIDNWAKKITGLYEVKKTIYLNDTKYFWTFCPPDAPANEEILHAVELFLGHELDLRYREFLKHANGWRGVFQAQDLFGTDDLFGGTRMDIALEIIEAIGLPNDELARGCGTRFLETMPIAVDTEGTAIFLQHNTSGVIYWINGGLIEEYRSFDDYFDHMAELNKDELQRVISEKSH